MVTETGTIVISWKFLTWATGLSIISIGALVESIRRGVNLKRDIQDVQQNLEIHKRHTAQENQVCDERCAERRAEIWRVINDEKQTRDQILTKLTSLEVSVATLTENISVRLENLERTIKNGNSKN